MHFVGFCYLFSMLLQNHALPLGTTELHQLPQEGQPGLCLLPPSLPGVPSRRSKAPRLARRSQSHRPAPTTTFVLGQVAPTEEQTTFSAFFIVLFFLQGCPLPAKSRQCVHLRPGALQCSRHCFLCSLTDLPANRVLPKVLRKCDTSTTEINI